MRETVRLASTVGLRDNIQIIIILAKTAEAASMQYIGNLSSARWRC